ncbi:MAG: hypothetical protein IPL20_06290 [Saprospiraceae bacterium]|nr:hypothetical protein [Saprospiraceae bacterium]
MIHFSFNECFPKTEGDDFIVNCLKNSLSEFNKVKSKFGCLVNGILTDREPKKIQLSNNLNLADSIKYLDRDNRIIALTNFNKYPIEDYCDFIDYDEILSKNYFIIVDNVNYDSLNAKISQLNDGILFSLAIHSDLKQNYIIIHEVYSKDKSNVLNHFGDINNSEFIIQTIHTDIINAKNGFEKFISLFENPIYLNSFRQDFEKLNVACQDAIIKGFTDAIGRKLPTNFSADGNLIKDVTNVREKEINVFELRIFSPVAIRVYFYEKSQKIYFGSVKRKPSKKVQNNDIEASKSTIKELVKLGK